MSEKRLWARHVFFTLTEHGAIRVLDALFTLTLIRVMSAPHFGLFSVYQSWVGMILLVLPSLESVLYREYGALKSQGRLRSELGVYRVFNLLKLGIAFVLLLGLAIVPQDESYERRLAILALALALPVSQAMYGYLREPLRFEMRQDLVTVLSALQRAALLGAVWAIARFTSADIIGIVSAALLVYVVFGFVWSFVGLKRDKVSFAHARSRILAILGGTIVWIHLNGVAMVALQTLDTFWLNVFHVPLDEIGRYSIALKASNFFQMIPLALVNAFGVYLGKKRGELKASEETALMKRYTVAFIGVGALLFAFGLAVDEPLLRFLGKGKFDKEQLSLVTAYFRWQLAGILIFCASHPLTTYLSAGAPVRKLCLRVYLPWTALSAAIYMVAARQGALVAARANVVVYAVLMLLGWLFYAQHRRRGEG